jgi:hypothetical protein
VNRLSDLCSCSRESRITAPAYPRSSGSSLNSQVSLSVNLEP